MVVKIDCMFFVFSLSSSKHFRVEIALKNYCRSDDVDGAEFQPVGVQ